jgi:hypothetical protein
MKPGSKHPKLDQFQFPSNQIEYAKIDLDSLSCAGSLKRRHGMSLRLSFNHFQTCSDTNKTELTASPNMATFPKEKNGRVGKTLTAQRVIFKSPKH